MAKDQQMVMYEEEFNQIQTVVDRLVREANAKVVFIVDKNGQLIAASGEVDNIDTTSLASLTAQYLDLRLPKGDRLTDWSNRPLTAGQLSYAAADVAHPQDQHGGFA